MRTSSISPHRGRPHSGPYGIRAPAGTMDSQESIVLRKGRRCRPRCRAPSASGRFTDAHRQARSSPTRKGAANIANARKSTGPRTAEGKALARYNAIRHGLRPAEQVVLPWEDADAFEAMRSTWIDEWKPPTAARRALVELAVVQAWAVRRGIAQHRDVLAGLGYAAIDRHDRDVEARMAGGLGLLPDDPRR